MKEVTWDGHRIRFDTIDLPGYNELTEPQQERMIEWIWEAFTNFGKYVHDKRFGHVESIYDVHWTIIVYVRDIDEAIKLVSDVIQEAIDYAKTTPELPWYMYEESEEE